MFHGSILFLREILQLAAGRFEGVTDRHVDVFVRCSDFLFFFVFFALGLLSDAVEAWLVIGDKFATRNCQINSNVKAFSALMTSMQNLGHHAASNNPIVEFREFLYLFAESRFYCW